MFIFQKIIGGLYLYNMLSQDPIRILILGDSGVGKSTFLHTFINGYIHNKKQIYPTVGISYEPATISYKNTQHKLFFFDSSGQGKFKAFLPNYYKNIRCIIYMYDITINSTKDNIITLINESKETLNKYDQKIENITGIIIANKYDLIINHNDNERNDIINQCKELSENTDLDVFLCSSKLELEGHTSRNGIYHLIQKYEKNQENNIEDKGSYYEPKILITKVQVEEDNDNCACISQ